MILRPEGRRDPPPLQGGYAALPIPGALPRAIILRAVGAATWPKFQWGINSLSGERRVSKRGTIQRRNFFLARVFVLADSLFEFAPCCGLTPPLDPQAAGLSIEGRAVPDYGAPFNFFAVLACPVLPSHVRACHLAFPVPLPLLLAVGCSTYMGTSTNYLPCDGCGLPASPEHIAERVRRLELSTRFRPIHMGVLFVALAPPDSPAKTIFMARRESKEFFDPFLEALEILFHG